MLYDTNYEMDEQIEYKDYEYNLQEDEIWGLMIEADMMEAEAS